MGKTILIIWTFITLLVYGSILISPRDIEFIGLVGFAIPVFVMVNLVFSLFAWIYSWKAKWVVSLLVLIAWPFYGFIFQLNAKDVEDVNGLKVMSQNLMRFNHKSESPFTQFEKIIDTEQPDVMLLQEFAATKRYRSGILEKLAYKEALGGYANSFAVYSKYPILNSGVLFKQSETNNIQFADLQIGMDTIRVYNLHLQSMGINPKKLNSPSATQDDIEAISLKFTTASKIRSIQMETLLSHIDSCNYPIIVAGDFNDIPFSNNYFKLKRRLNNSFQSKGQGIGATFNAGLPFLRIDNQFYSDDIQLLAFKTFNKTFFSDHFPLIGIYNLSP